MDYDEKGLQNYRLLAQFLSAHAIGAGLGFDSGAGQIGTVETSSKENTETSQILPSLAQMAEWYRAYVS